MSSSGLSRKHSVSSGSKLSASKRSTEARQTPPPTTLTPDNANTPFEPCAATASFLLYAQRNRVLVLHHDTLAIERRFDLHREDVLWIAVDNASDRGSGRLAVSYDAGNTAIVWDILTGGEISRFSAYEHIKVASFMRNGNIAFGNDQGNIILFEPSTSEHISARTIFDPITAIAPAADCRTFAIGYLNGSILVATLQPSFTIQHTLTTTRAPSRITGLAWHGSSSKQKTDMLATQTQDGDLRVWSVPKPPLHEVPTIIRVLQRAEYQQPGPCWFAWSKNGRIVQYADGETRAWDVRTKKVSWEAIPTVEGVTGIAIYGPSAVLFTLSRGHGVQQYDVNPNGTPLQVASVKHMPSNTPPTPPTTLDDRKHHHSKSRGAEEAAMLPTVSDTGESSTDEGASRSPLQRIAKEMESLDAMEDELRDKVMPLSPNSSRTSSVSSKSSGGRRRDRKYLYDRPDSSRAPSSSGQSGQMTEFSSGTPAAKPGHDSMSIRSVSSLHSTSRYRTSSLRNQVMRSPEETRSTASMELFPSAKTRLRDVPFRTPHYGNVARTPELLQREMLSVLFGWNDTARSLIRDEMQRHKPGSAAAVLLAKWLGDVGADQMASMVGSESMTSADWMMLALSSIGIDSQKKVGEAFVQRLLEKGDVHPAVAILVGLGEYNDAIEVYVSQKYYVEAVLLTCLTCASDWQRISYLIRKWGEAAVQQGQSELAVRCFSCTSIETSEPWFSPRAQDAAYVAQQERLTRPPSAGGLSSPPLSPPSRSNSQRLTQKNASLKLITSFGDAGVPVSRAIDEATPMNAMGVTPIAQSALPQSALSPGGQEPLRARFLRDPSSARTATPGGYTRKKRIPSRSDIERARQETADINTPITTTRATPPNMPPNRRTSSIGSDSLPEPLTTVKSTAYSDRLAPESSTEDGNRLPSPSAGAFVQVLPRRNASQERKPDGLAVQVMETRYMEDGPSEPGTGRSLTTHSSRSAARTPSSAKGSSTSRMIDDFINSIDESRDQTGERRAHSRRRGESRKRDGSRGPRAASRPRELSETRGRDNARYIKPAKRSPSSPVPMSPEEIAQASAAAKPKPEPATSEDENFYKVASPVESQRSIMTHKSEPNAKTSNRASGGSTQSASLAADSGRGRAEQRQPGSSARSPSLPLQIPPESKTSYEQHETSSDGQRVRYRADSLTSDAYRRERSTSRKRGDGLSMPTSTVSKSSGVPEGSVVGSELSTATSSTSARPRGMSRKELAARELEERRLSLARRPSAPSIPLPGETQSRPTLGQRSNTVESVSPTSFNIARAQTVDPDQMSRYGRVGGTSTPSAPVGLPATPRAMRLPRHMAGDPNERGNTPPVPEMPDNASNLSYYQGSTLSQASNIPPLLPSLATTNLTGTSSNLNSNVSYDTTPSMVSSSQVSANPQIYDEDSVAPLLPSTVFGQKVPVPEPRAASAPPEKSRDGVHPAYQPNLPRSTSRNMRKISPPVSQNDKPVASIDEALAASGDQQVVVIPEEPYVPPMLPELQHLAGPPPPPPPPPTLITQSTNGQVNSSGVINIAIDENAPSSAVDAPMTLPSTTYPQPMERATTASPTAHRRGRGSVSETFGSRFRDIGDRMRSTSRNRTTKSPVDYKATPYETVLPPMPLQHRRHESETRSPAEYKPAPYETVLPPQPETRAKSPYEQMMAAQNQQQGLQQQQIPPPPPPPPKPTASAGPDGRLQEIAIPPSTLPRSSSVTGYRNPKEIRANMPPETLQQGVYERFGQQF